MSKLGRFFKPLDILTFGGPCALADFLIYYSATHGVSGQPLMLLIAVAGLFNLFYAYIIYYRWQTIKDISYSVYGMDIICAGHPVKKEDMEKIIDETITKWAEVLKAEGVKEPYTLCTEALDGYLLKWEDFPIVNSWGKFAGFIIGECVQVAYKEDLNQTALAHEVGHLFMVNWKGTINNEQHHSFMQEHKLP